MAAGGRIEMELAVAVVWTNKDGSVVEGSKSHLEGRLYRAWNAGSEGERRNGLVVGG